MQLFNRLTAGVGKGWPLEFYRVLSLSVFVCTNWTSTSFHLNYLKYCTVFQVSKWKDVGDDDDDDDVDDDDDDSDEHGDVD